MSTLDKKNNVPAQNQHGLSLLNVAEIALAVGASCGFIAVLALLLQSWPCMLIGTFSALTALILALVMLSMPSPSGDKKPRPEPSLSVIPKPSGADAPGHYPVINGQPHSSGHKLIRQKIAPQALPAVVC